VIVSIFVNPTQFAPNEDLATYPRTFAADIAALAKLKVDLVWSPSVETMYPAGFATRIVPEGEGAATAGLEDAVRPQFFSGVATVVAKLLIQCEPDFALFGEKDYQQLKVVTRLAADLGLKTRIVAAPIVRERDGLALSSRNRYLLLSERLAAPALYRVLKESAGAIAAGDPVAAVLEKGRKAIAEAGFRLDYLEARHADTLAPLADIDVADDVARIRVDRDRAARTFPRHPLHGRDQSVAVGIAAGLLEGFVGKVQAVIGPERDEIRPEAVRFLNCPR